MKSSYVLHIVDGQATTVVAGPCTLAEAYHFATLAMMTDDGSSVVILPEGIVSDILRRQVALAQ